MREYIQLLLLLLRHGLAEASLPKPLNQRWVALLFPPLLPALLLSLALRGQLNAALAIGLGVVIGVSGWHPGGGFPIWMDALAVLGAVNALLVVFFPIREVAVETDDGRVIQIPTLPVLIPVMASRA